MKLLSYKQLNTVFLSASLLLASCDKDDEKKLSPDEAQQALTTADTKVSTSLEKLSNSPGFTALEDLSSLTGAGAPLPFRANNADKKNPRILIRKAIVGLKQIATAPAKNSRSNGDDAFEFNENLGVYAWNPASEDFQFVSSSSIIEINFPTENSVSNNAKFKLTAYDEKATPNGDEAYSPTIIEATLAINNTQAASLSLDVDYINDGSDEPLRADITYNVGEFSVDVDYDNSANSQTSFSETLREGNTIIVGWGIDAVFKTAQKLENDIKSLTGFFQLVNVRFNIVITEVDANSTDLSDFINITVSVDNNAAGQVVFVNDNNGETVPYIQYTDGSQQPLEDVFEEFGEALDELDVIG